MKKIIIIISLIAFIKCKEKSIVMEAKEFVWSGANIYFLLTDRFNNGETSNDVNFKRAKETAVLRGFEGGDFKGITKKINEGYFTKLGINAIWMTPVVEQIHGSTDEGTGVTYGYHGYWTKDWTNIDPNYGTKKELKELVATAHKHGIRILLDAVINHTGPVTEKDPAWPSEWVRTKPKCEFNNYKNTVACTLVKNLPDIKTESNENVELPKQLVEKWKAEGRYNQEMKELNEFFKRTGYPRAPRFYIIKWLSDYITEFGIDGYRVDTVKHVEEHVWKEFRKECDYAFAKYKKNNPDKVLDSNDFYLVGEVYNYKISEGKYFSFSDKKVNYFKNGFNSLINFELKQDAKQMSEEDVFRKYNKILQTNLKGYGVLNYMTSHDDGTPYDKERKMTYKTATILLLTNGASQVYYGDESARSLIVKGTNGDATLRSFMNWEKINKNKKVKKLHKHWQKLGQFRANHMAVGAGVHKLIFNKNGLVFSRTINKDKVVIGINLPKGGKVISVSTAFKNDEKIRDFYSGKTFKVVNGKVKINSKYDIVLLEKIL